MKSTDTHLAQCYAEIEAALREQTASKFRAKYPGACACCGHKFRPPAEIVYKLAPGRLVCWDCVQAVRHHGEYREYTNDFGETVGTTHRAETLPDIR